MDVKKICKQAGKKVDELIDFKKLFEGGKLKIVGAGLEVIDDNLANGLFRFAYNKIPEDYKKDYLELLIAFTEGNKQGIADNLGDITNAFVNLPRITEDVEDAFFDAIFLALLQVIGTTNDNNK
jgi:hypothetical protein